MTDCRLLLLTALVSIVVREGLSAKCNDDVITAIQKLWREKGTPVSLEKQLIEARESFIVATSPGVFHDETNIKCLEAITTERDYFMIIVHKNGSLLVTENYVLKERRGVLYTPGDEQFRYHIPTLPNSNVQAFYTCREDGSSGDDRGLIRVVGHPTRHSKAAVKKAIKDFAKLGITISTSFADSCEE